MLAQARLRLLVHERSAVVGDGAAVRASPPVDDGATTVFFATRAARPTTVPGGILVSACRSNSNMVAVLQPAHRGETPDRCPCERSPATPWMGRLAWRAPFVGQAAASPLRVGRAPREKNFLPHCSHEMTHPCRDTAAPPWPSLTRAAGAPFASTPAARRATAALMLASCSWGQGGSVGRGGGAVRASLPACRLADSTGRHGANDFASARPSSSCAEHQASGSRAKPLREGATRAASFCASGRSPLRSASSRLAHPRRHRAAASGGSTPPGTGARRRGGRAPGVEEHPVAVTGEGADVLPGVGGPVLEGGVIQLAGDACPIGQPPQRARSRPGRSIS